MPKFKAKTQQTRSAMRSHLNAIEEWSALAKEARYRCEKLARLCHVSSRQLERYFKEHFEAPPQKYLDELMLREATTRLLRGCPVKQVAFESGFSDPSHFIRRFKQ